MGTKLIVWRDQNLPTFTKWLRWIVGPDPESKRHMSGVLLGVGVLLVPLSQVDGWEPVSPWLMGAGVVFMVLGWAGANAAAGQASIEGRARDLIEWKREEQEFRRGIGDLWRRLKRVYVHYRAIVDSLPPARDDLVADSGWPGSHGETASHLQDFLARCLPPHGTTAEIPNDRRHAFDHILGRGERHLEEEWGAVRDILEVWDLALDAGGGRADTLRGVIRGLRAHHEGSLRLARYLSAAHAARSALPTIPTMPFWITSGTSCSRNPIRDGRVGLALPRRTVPFAHVHALHHARECPPWTTETPTSTSEGRAGRCG